MAAKKVVAAQPVAKGSVARKRLSEPSTWAGLLSIAALVATKGATALYEPGNIMAAASGLALIFTKEP